MADIDYDKLAKAIKVAMGGGGGFSSGGGGSFGSGVIDKMASSTNVAAAALGGLARATEGNLKVWRDLSSNGANFSNDLIGMSVSAAKGRMSLEEFGEVVKDNVKSFTGLGGNATRGAEVFAKFSEQMSKQGVTDNLRQLGYTSKEANDLLALQLATTRSSQALDEEGRRRAATATKNLADEMDLTAKLTGRSRKEQEDRMKALQLDAQVENKIRLETRGMSQKDAEAYRTNVMRVLKEAQERGSGEMAKERYAVGTVTTEVGKTQAALRGDEYAALDKSFKAIRAGQTELAKGYELEAKAAALRAQDNPMLQQLGALGEAGGMAATVVNQSTAETRALYDATKRIKEQFGDLDTTTESYKLLLQKTIAEAQKPQQGIGEEGKRVDGVLQTALSVGKAFEDARAVIAETLSVALKEAAQQGGAVLGAGISSAVNELYGNIDSALKAVEKLNAGDVSVTSDQLGVIGTGIDFVKKSADGLVGLFTSGSAKTQVKMGVFGEGGFVDKPQIAVVGDVPEHIVPKQIMENIISNATQAGMQANKNLGSMDLSELPNKILTSISSISSTVSGGGSTTTKRVQSEGSKSAETMRDFLEEELRKYKKETFDKYKEQLGPGATLFQTTDALKNDVEYKETIKEAEKELQRLERKIAEGISFEVEQKEKALEKTKDIIEKNVSGMIDIVESGESILKNSDILAANPMQKDPATMAAEIAERLPKAANPMQKDPASMAAMAQEKTNPLKNIFSADGSIDLNALSNSEIGKSLKIGGVSAIAAASPTTQTGKPGESAQAQAAAKGAAQPTATPAADSAKPKPTNNKPATLDDVVTSLDRLNKQMGQLISQQSDLLSKQIKTTKAAGSTNLFEKVTP